MRSVSRRAEDSLDKSNVRSYDGVMIGVDVVGLVTVLTATDPAACDRAALASLVTTAQRPSGLIATPSGSICRCWCTRT